MVLFRGGHIYGLKQDNEHWYCAHIIGDWWGTEPFCSCVHARDSNRNVSPMSSRNCMIIPKVPSPEYKLKVCSCILHSCLVQRSECLPHPASDRNYVRLSKVSSHTMKFSFDQQKTAANQTVEFILVLSGWHSCLLLSVLRQVHSLFHSEFFKSAFPSVFNILSYP